MIGVHPMDIILLARQAALYLHVLAFAVAVAEVVRGDLRLLKQPRIDGSEMLRTGHLVSLALVALWGTGLALVYLETGFDLAQILAKPKLVAKLVVVGALTANGFLLHAAAFPMLTGGRVQPRNAALMCSMLGAVSTVSWLYASFLGVGRIIAPQMTVGLFLDLYGLALVGGLLVAVVVVTPVVARRIERGPFVLGLADEIAWERDGDTETVVGPDKVNERSAA